ncbi:MAG TPA: hypothetical protein VGK20_19010 [Candidatus Binatia bacterium]
MAEAPSPLRAKIEALPLAIHWLTVCIRTVPMPSYPGGERPSATIIVGGDGERGLGEHVGWSDADHSRFAEAVQKLPIRPETTVGQWSGLAGDLPAYDRAAIEAAAIDLALRQQHTNLFRLTAVDPRPVRYVLSFARMQDPVREITEGFAGPLEVKIDLDPAWPDSVLKDLAALGRVAVLDCKDAGSVEDAERACALVPGCRIEDPPLPRERWSASLRARFAADSPVISAEALEHLVPRPLAVNIKAPRLGGVLEAIDCIARARTLGIEPYIGGMFEAGVGRSQALVLAALACPEGTNDVAPLVGSAGRPLRLDVDARAPGFGEHAR